MHYLQILALFTVGAVVGLLFVLPIPVLTRPLVNPWVIIKRMNEVIKRLIFGAAYPLLTIIERQARLTGNWTDHFVARTVFDQFSDVRVERDHAIQEMREDEIDRQIRETNEAQERFDHEVHSFIVSEQRVPSGPPTSYGTPVEYNYVIQARQHAPTAAQLAALQGNFDRAGQGLQTLNAAAARIHIENMQQIRAMANRPKNIPPITQENCMHYFQEFHAVNRPTLRICEICGFEEGGPPKTPGGLKNCTHEWGGLNSFKSENGKITYGRSCLVCGKFKNEQVVKSISELRQSKVRSLILEVDNDQNLPSV